VPPVPTRLHLVLAVIVALTTCALLALIATAGSGGVSLPSNGFAGALRPPAMPASDFTLVDQDGRAVAVRSYRGQVVVVTFMYSTCQDTCPITAQQIRGALDDLPHDVPTLAISVDPVNDTQVNMRSFLVRQHLSGRMEFLRGTASELGPVWRAYGIQPQGPGRGLGFDHSAYTILLDQRGRQRIGFPTDKLTPEGLAHDIRRLQAERPA
jgi:protein SCO1